jgi:protein-L-isoaspartate(D-aspartate) O-methyltransferase
MTQLARPAASDRALEVGTGSGYQAAVLSQLVSHVYTIELIEPLAHAAERKLKDLGYRNITVKAGDGYAGWPDMAPFDIILVTAAPEEVPDALIKQLKPGGRLVVPIGPAYSTQELRVLEKTASGDVRTERIAPVMFVPMRKQ